MSNIERLKANDELKKIVKVLVTDFPNISITTDIKDYPLFDGTVIIQVIGQDEHVVLNSINKVLPGYDLESADSDLYSVYVYCLGDEPMSDDICNLWG